ncbi:MAG: hypothetical protein AAF714_09290 [Pseudomonadota bacterium]
MVTTNAVVALDLTEMLTARGAQVDTLRALNTPPPQPYGLAFLDSEFLSRSDDHLLEAIRAVGTTVFVLLTVADEVFEDAGAIPLVMPFTSRDVDELISTHRPIIV